MCAWPPARAAIEQGFHRGNYPALNELFAADYAEHQFGLPSNLEGFKEKLRQLRSAFPDLHLTIEDQVEQDDRVWVRMTAHGTHTGPIMHRPPTGRPFIIDVCRLQAGKIVEHWGVADRFALTWQLERLPRPERQPA